MSKLSKFDHFKVVSLYLVLSIVLTYPFILNMSDISGPDDNYLFIHSFWWFKKSLFSLQNPFFTDFIFYPKGTSLVYHGATFSNFLITLPVSIVFGVNEAVNTSYILTFVLSGYTAFLLALELTGSRPASVIAGLIFAFNPIHSMHGRAQLHGSTLQWIPLFFLMLKRTIECRELKWPIFAGLLMGTIILTDQMQTICVALITALAIPFLFFIKKSDNRESGSLSGWKRVINPNSKKIVVSLLIIGITAALMTSFYLYQVVQEMIRHPESVKVGPMEHGGANMFSGDLMGYFIPRTSHPVLGRFVTSFGGAKDEIYIGYVPLFLAILGAFKFFRIGIVRYIAGISILFWILSLGTYLHIGGVWKWDGASYGLPYLYLTDIPMIGDIRTPFRFHFITMTGISLLAGYGVIWLQEHRQIAEGKACNWACLTIAGIILFEYLPVSQPITFTHIPELYHEMAKDKEPYTVLELPLSRWSGIYRNGSGNPSIMLYYQTVHEKKIVGGILTRLPKELLAFKDPILDLISALTAEDNFRISGRQKRELTDSELSEVRQTGIKMSLMREQFFRDYNIKYIVLHAPIEGNTLSKAFIEGFTGKTMVNVPQDHISYIKVQ